MSWRRWSTIAAIGVCACGGAAAGTHPRDMSATHHEEAARRDEAAAATDCDAAAGEPCWSQESPQAAEHRRMAAEHRAAAQALLDAEARACIGIDEVDRDTSPFEHSTDIASVAPLTEPVPRGRAAPEERLVGAIVVFRAVRGMTAEWLQRTIDCHLARNAAVGHEMPEMPDCPLVPATSAHVRSTGTGFAVDIRGADAASAEEILRRAQRLVAPAGD